MGDLQTLFTGLVLAAEEGSGGKGVQHTPISASGLLAYLVLTVGSILVFIYFARKGVTNKVFNGKPANWSEQLFLFIQNLCLGIIGPHGKKYVPMMLTVWLVIFTSNLISLFFPTAPTADLSFNLGLALLMIGYVQYEGIKANGFFGHLGHFAGPKLPLAMIPITGMIFSVEILSECMKLLSLSLRLYGNIDGGHQAVVAMNELGKSIKIGNIPFPIPFGLFLLPIKLLTVLVQALVFTALNCVYLGLVTHHEEHDDDHAKEHDLATAH